MADSHFDCQNDLLFLGAGFSAAAGGLLSREFWSGITHHEAFARDRCFRRVEDNLVNNRFIGNGAIGRDYDYEELYLKLHENCPDKYDKAIDILQSVFRMHQQQIDMQLNIRSDHGQRLNFRLVRAFLKSFAGTKEKPGYIFTTNQDQFIEKLCRPLTAQEQRRFIGDNRPDRNGSNQIITIPGQDMMGDCISQRPINPEELESSIISTLHSSPHLNYIKLHGDSELKENKRPLLLFGGRYKDPQEFTFTSVNYRILKNCLSHCRRMTFIGFSFYDRSILEIIAKNGIKSGTKIVVINPASLFEFVHKLQDDIREIIRIPMVNVTYFPCSLEEMFPGGSRADSPHSYWLKLVLNCLERELDHRDY